MAEKQVRCGLRKLEKCLEVPDKCEWNGQKCVKKEKGVKKESPKASPKESPKVSPKASPKESPKVSLKESPKASPKVKKVRCGGRKEKACMTLPDKCTWNGEKCIDNKLKESAPPKVSPKKSPVVKVAPKVKKVVVKLKKASPKVSPKPSPKEYLPVAYKSYIEDVKALDNRHCMLYSNKPLKHLNFTDVVDTKTCYKAAYDPKYQSKTNVHIGQRKLLMSEIQLLTEHYEKYPKIHPTMMYVGAAPGSHLTLLSLMFPQVYFILYDGAKFDPELKKYPRVFQVHEGEDGFVTTEKIKKLKDNINTKNLIFVSDIRLGDDDKEKFEQGVSRDMLLQQEWVQILKPLSSLLKFRMSYHMKAGDKLKYMKGKIFYQVWPKPQSGETRLLVERKDVNNIVEYDFTDYEQTMFFHNKTERPYCYGVDNKFKKYILKKNNPYCSCYDCMSELSILDRFAKLVNAPLDRVVADVAKFMNRERVPVFLTKGNGGVKSDLQAISPDC